MGRCSSGSGSAGSGSGSAGSAGSAGSGSAGSGSAGSGSAGQKVKAGLSGFEFSKAWLGKSGAKRSLRVRVP